MPPEPAKTQAGEGDAKRPRVTLNAAVSLDGRIAGAEGRTLRLSDEADQKRVHRLRNEREAILVGVGTVIADNPALLVREPWVEEPRHPMRVVLDTHGRIPASSRVLDDTAPTRVYTSEDTRQALSRGTPGNDTQWVGVPAEHGQLNLKAVLADLAGRGIRTLLVEGGSRVIASFLETECVDEAYLFVAPVIVGEGAPALVAASARGSSPLTTMRVVEATKRETGVLLELAPKSPA